jgi:hypothetical protein
LARGHDFVKKMLIGGGTNSLQFGYQRVVKSTEDGKISMGGREAGRNCAGFNVVVRGKGKN